MDAYGAGKYAMVTEGSWNTKAYWNLKGVKSVLAPTPVGPTGKRASLFNGLADNISASTDTPDAGSVNPGATSGSATGTTPGATTPDTPDKQ